MALSLIVIASLVMDSEDSDTSIQDIVLQQVQHGYAPYPMPTSQYQHPGYPNQCQLQQKHGYIPSPIPPIPPPQYQYAASYPSYSAPAQQMPGCQSWVVDNQPVIQLHPKHMKGLRPVPNYLYLSIFTTLCCCCCLGIGAIVTSNQANALMYSQPKEAKRKAATAFKLNIVGIVIGFVVAFTCAVLRLMG